MIVIVTVTDYADDNNHSDGYMFIYIDTIVENKTEAVMIVTEYNIADGMR